MNLQKSVLALSLLLASVVVNAQNQENMETKQTSYEKSWVKIEQFIDNDQPKSAIKETEKVYKKASGEGNFGELVKAGLTMMSMRTSISPDSMVVDVEQLESIIKEREASAVSPRSWAEVALLHTLAASVYDVWKFTSLTYSDEEALSMSQRRKAEHIQAATAHASDIAGVSVRDCRPLFEDMGDDSRFFNDDALSAIVTFFEDASFLSKEEEWKLYRQCADIYKEKGMREAEALMRLKELDQQNRLSSYKLRLRNADYEEALRQMVDTFGDTEVGADVYWDWMQEHDRKTWQEELELAREGQRRWPNSKMLNQFKKKEMECLNPSLSVYVRTMENDGTEMADKPLMVQVTHRNIGDADIVVKRLRPKGKLTNLLLCREKTEDMNEAETVWTQHLSFDAHKAHPELAEEYQRDTLELNLPAGVYRILLKGGGLQTSATCQLSTIQVMTVSLQGGKRVATVVNSKTGYPVVGCEVIGIWTKYVDSKWKTFSKTYISDEKGQVVVDPEVSSVAARLTPDDESMEVSVANELQYYPRDIRTTTSYQAFTDRAIYRPGQTVQVSGFVYDRQEERTNACAGMEVEMSLLDANWQVLQKAKLTTDKFGAVHTDFVLPTDRLNGTWRIRFGNHYCTFSVEEYKRPTFTVEMEDTPGNFALGDTIEVTGIAKTYSGVPVQNAKVSFTVSQRKSTYWTWRMMGAGWKQVENGETQTDEEGRFRVKVYLDDDLVRSSSEAEMREVDGRLVLYDFSGVMQYRVEAKVTDLAGETHEDDTSIQVSSREFDLDFTMSSNIDKSTQQQEELRVVAQNAQGQDVEAQGTWSLCRYNKVKKEYSEEVATGTFTTNQPFRLPSLSNLTLGSYEIKFLAQDSRHHDIRTSARFVLWDRKRGGTMNLATDWVYAPDQTMSPEKGIDVWYAVEKPDAYTFLYVVSNQDLVLEKIAVHGTDQQHLHLDYKPAYGEGLRFHLSYVKDGRQHKINQSFTLVRPEKNLKLSWTTFRDKLTPGQQETWTLRVVDKDGKPVPASVMATMYDASLDFFVRHNWPFSLYFSRNVPSVYSYISDLGSVPSLSLSFRPEYPSVYSRTFNELRPFNDYDNKYGGIRRKHFEMNALGGAPVLLESRAVMRANTDRLNAAEPVEDAAAENEKAEQDAASSATTPPLRENFNETAFFQPNLHTDAQGNVSISFTLPDCLTEWRVMGLAHTVGIDYGHLESTVLARKEFMVQPNMPRFVRQGDRMSIATKIINTSEKDLNGTALIRLINPEDNAVVLQTERPFSVAAEQTTSVSFDYDVPEQYPMLVCEISGQAGSFSDGERNYIPVLSSRRYVTETVPFYLEEAGTKSVDLSSLFNGHSPTATLRRMTFEYTDNPSWQAILALHAVITPDNDDAVDWAASLYANRVAQSIGQRMPRLLELIMRWNSEEGDETTLTSELEKNQELKEILLQESPWMLDAQDETHQRQMLCELFDQKLLNRRINVAKEKLQKLQFSSGGWTWFQGMEPSYYVTLSVSEHMSNLLNYLRSQDEEDKDVLAMLRKSIKYLDGEELEYYRKYGRKDKKGLPSESTLRYLYLRTLVPEALKTNREVDAMKKFYLDKTEKRVKQLSMYGRANVAVILYDDHRDQAARRFVQSLHEYTVTRPGMGRYFDTDKAQYSWCDYRIPTHIAAMRSFMTCLKKEASKAPDGLCQDDLLEMQLWLLRQKQTQKWDNVLNTLAVADLLLTIDPETAFHEAQLPSVSFGSQTLEIGNQTAGVGYSKTPVPEAMIDAAEATITKTTPGISWGCVYGQCLESLDRLQKTSGELTVDRKAYVEQVVDGQKQWRELAEGEPLRVGDKVRLRHIVTSDRDMDFVQIRSQYAACLEPLRQTSGYQWLGGRGCYLAMHDASADLFFDRFLKGTSTLDLEFYVTRPGRYSLGVATVQCAYAPAFSGHSAGASLQVGE